MSANDDFEAFAQRFDKKYGYLPLGKDCGIIGRPPVEDVLCDLGRTLGELETLELAVHAANSQSVAALQELLYCNEGGELTKARIVCIVADFEQRLNAGVPATGRR